MRNGYARWIFPVCLVFVCLVGAQEKRPPTAAVKGIKGVKEDAAAKVKNVETGSATRTKSSAQGVNKIDGIDTIKGVKADGRTPVLPPPPKVPPVVAVKGTAVNVGGGKVGNIGSIRAVQGVAGIGTPQLKNLEAALLLKQGGGGTPVGGAGIGGKGTAAAAALLGAPLGVSPKAGPKADGRAGFQEFVIPPKTGS